MSAIADQTELMSANCGRKKEKMPTTMATDSSAESTRRTGTCRVGRLGACSAIGPETLMSDSARAWDRGRPAWHINAP